jgi:DUF1680 family protein
MWDAYSAGEFGGANEVSSEIYALTGDDQHLQTAKAFDNRVSLFGAAVADHDILVMTPQNRPGRRRPERLHANQHVPQFLGYLRVFEQNGESEYFTAAKNFFGWVVPHREFASGGTGGDYPGGVDNPEMFQNRDNIANAIAHNGAETCTTYNTLKLARNLFLLLFLHSRGVLHFIFKRGIPSFSTTCHDQKSKFKDIMSIMEISLEHVR